MVKETITVFYPDGTFYRDIFNVQAEPGIEFVLIRYDLCEDGITLHYISLQDKNKKMKKTLFKIPYEINTTYSVPEEEENLPF